MKTGVQKIDIIRFSFRQEKDDSDYGSCLWAVFDVDPSMGLLSIHSDCGDLSHMWPETGKDFLELLAGLENSNAYLLEKLAGPPRMVERKKTLDALRRALVEAEMHESVVEEAMEDIEEKLSGCSGASADYVGEIICRWNEEYFLDLSEPWEYVHKEHSPEDKRLVRIFRKRIIPMIRKFASENSTNEKNIVHSSESITDVK